MAYFRLSQIFLCLLVYKAVLFNISTARSPPTDVTQTNDQERNLTESEVIESLTPVGGPERIIKFGELVKDVDQRILEFQESLAFSGSTRTGRYLAHTSPCLAPAIVDQEFVDLAFGRKTFATSNHDLKNHFQTNLVDGNFATPYASVSKEVQPWIGVDLEGCHRIFVINLHLRLNAHSRDLVIYVSDEMKEISNRDFSKDTLFASLEGPATNALYSFKPIDSQYVEGRYVYITKSPNTNHLDVTELEVLGF